MKAILFLVGMVVGSFSHAELINVKVTGRSKIKVYHYGDVSKKFKCTGHDIFVGPDGTYQNSESNYETSAENAFTQNGEFQVGLRTGNIIESPYHFTVDTKVSMSKDDQESETYKIEIVEDQISSFSHSWTSGCDNHHYNENLKNASYQVDVEFVYKVPDDVWAVDIVESDYDNLFSMDRTVGGNGQLDGQVFETKNQGPRRIWVKPGSIIKKSFMGHESKAFSANPEDSRHSYSITFKPVGKVLTAANMDIDWLDRFVRSLAETLHSNGDSSSSASEALNTLVIEGASVLRSREAFREAMGSLPTNKLKSVAESLFDIAITDLNIQDPEQENSVRIFAALASYEVASVLIEELAPYCEMQDVALPYTTPDGETVEVLGLHYATFLMNRMQKRINGSLIGFHRTYLDELNDISKTHSTYGSIFAEPNLTLKMRSSYDVMKRIAQPQVRPYAQALQDLADFYQVFRSVGTGEANTDNVISQMTALANMENQYLEGLFDHIARYSPNNNDPVDLSHLYRLLDKMQEQSDLVIKVTTENMRFLSVGDQNGLDNFVGLITALELHNLAIIGKPYKVHQFNFQFEEIRAAFNDAERTQRNIETVKRCQRQ